jgi:hypothetical protein
MWGLTSMSRRGIGSICDVAPGDRRCRRGKNDADMSDDIAVRKVPGFVLAQAFLLFAIGSPTASAEEGFGIQHMMIL